MDAPIWTFHGAKDEVILLWAEEGLALFDDLVSGVVHNTTRQSPDITGLLAVTTLDRHRSADDSFQDTTDAGWAARTQYDSLSQYYGSSRNMSGR
jgi:hypothetical protein